MRVFRPRCAHGGVQARGARIQARIGAAHQRPQDGSHGADQRPERAAAAKLRGRASEVGDTFSPKVSVSGTKIRLKYTAKSSLDSENSVVYEIPVSIAEKSDEYGIPVYDYAEMFYCGGSGIAKMGEKGVQFAFSEPVKYDFANKVNASFKVELSSEQGGNGFDAVKVTARDAQNKNVALSFTVYKNADGANSSVVLNDGQAYAAGGSLADFKDGFKLEFDTGFQPRPGRSDFNSDADRNKSQSQNLHLRRRNSVSVWHRQKRIWRMPPQDARPLPSVSPLRKTI